MYQNHNVVVGNAPKDLAFRVGSPETAAPESAPVRAARIDYLKALDDLQDLRTKEDWSDRIDLVRGDDYDQN